MASNVNFGPEWMRRAAKPANVNTAAAPAGAANTLPSPKAPLSTHPAFASDRSQPLPTLRGEPADPTSPSGVLSPTIASVTTTKATAQGSVTTTVTHGADGFETIEEVTVEEYLEADRPNPYRYDRELFLSLWKDIQPAGLPSDELEPIWSADVLTPVSSSPLTELEERIVASGSVNSEVTTRRVQGGAGGRRNTGGNRGQMQAQRGNRDYERGFREFINKVQTTDERPMWAYGQQGAPVAGAGFFDASGAYQYGRVAGAVYQDPAEVLWFYRDPQGNIQGPFTGADMHEWYKAGFFTAQLLVKRESDPQFIELGMLVQILGNDEEPFLVPIPATGAAAPAPDYGYQAPAAAPVAAAKPAAAAAATAAAPVNTKSRGAQSDLLRNISKELENAGGEDVKMWSQLGQPGPVPKSLREIQEDAKKKGGK